MAEDKVFDALNETRSNTPPPSSVKENEKSGAEENGDALERTTSKIENYPTGPKLAVILLSIYLSVFLVALDRTIIATALPSITNKFHSFGDVGWVCARVAPFLPACS